MPKALPLSSVNILGGFSYTPTFRVRGSFAETAGAIRMK
jgi:hypothetical protein